MKILSLIPDSLCQPAGGMGEMWRQILPHLRQEVTVEVVDACTFPSAYVTGMPEGITLALIRQAELVAECLKSESRPDLIHANDWSTGWAGMLLANHWNVPFVYHVHLHIDGIMTAIASQLSPYDPMIRALRDLEFSVMRRADAIIHVSGHYANHFSPLFRPKSVTIHNSVDADAFTGRDLEHENTPLRVVYLGRFASMKNVQSLLAADIPEGVEVWFAGSARGADSYLHDEVLAVTREHPQMRYVGPVYGEEKSRLLREADALIIPSLHEPFGIVALEAMAAGCVLLSSRQGGLAETLHTDCGLPCGTTVTSISEALSSLRNLSPGERRSMREAGMRHSRLWSYDKQARNLLDVYDAVFKRLLVQPTGA